MKFSSAIILFLVCIVAVSASASAQNIPPGTYQRSCTGIDADWHRLTATCRKSNGGWNFTVLEDYRRCESDIANNNGHLECANSWQNNDDGPSGDWAPNGSYQRSCRNIQTEQRTLTAECRDRNGRWRYTELDDYRRCLGDIENVNGMLRCQGNDDDDQDGRYNDLPGGNWRASCRNYRVYGSVLYAECRTRYGQYIQTTIDLRRCRQDVSNIDGRLTCGYAGSDGQGWARITLYKHSNFGGTARSYSADTPDLNNDAFGNIASSAVIQGGVWQICDRPYYRGYCIVLDRTHPNFSALGFNDRAESLRRIR